MSFCPFRFLLRKRKSKQKKPKYWPLFTPSSVSASSSGKGKVSKRNPSICRFFPPLPFPLPATPIYARWPSWPTGSAVPSTASWGGIGDGPCGWRRLYIIPALFREIRTKYLTNAGKRLIIVQGGSENGSRFVCIYSTEVYYEEDDH